MRILNSTPEETVVLVDECDNEIGVEGKLNAHLTGKLHRAISVFIFNDAGQMLLQQRASSKYHSAGLWSNACCSHPRPAESNLEAAQRRLFEEMGIRCELEKTMDFIYKVDVDHDLIEHEFDHVFIGVFNGDPVINPKEASSWKWMDADLLREDIAKNPGRYTTWFKIILDRVLSPNCCTQGG